MKFKESLFIDKIDCNFDSFIKSLLENYDKKNPNRPANWDCLVDSSINVENEKRTIPKYILTEIEKIIKKFEISLNNSFFKNLHISHCWYNIYSKNMYQEIHAHCPSLFSGCFYLKYNKKVHTSTVFYNNNFPIDYQNSEFADVELIQYVPDVDQNTIIIFPSNMPHEVKPQTTDEERITISFNITCDQIIREVFDKKLQIFY
jgi:uncharacterized protein (TIGR02466 family)